MSASTPWRALTTATRVKRLTLRLDDADLAQPHERWRTGVADLELIGQVLHR